MKSLRGIMDTKTSVRALYTTGALIPAIKGFLMSMIYK